MAKCKYCSEETGGSLFCQNCGAKVDQIQEAPPIAPQIAPQPVYPQQMQMPVQQPYYTPKGAGGLLAGNIIVLVLSCIFFCGLTPIISIALSIIGIVFSVKAGHAKSLQESNSNRTVAIIMLILGIVFLVIGIILVNIVVYQNYGGWGGYFDEIMENAKNR